MDLISAFRRQRQVDFYEFKANLVYRVSSGTGTKATGRKPVSTKKNKQTTNKIYIYIYTYAFCFLLYIYIYIHIYTYIYIHTYIHILHSAREARLSHGQIDSSAAQ